MPQKVRPLQPCTSAPHILCRYCATIRMDTGWPSPTSPTGLIQTSEFVDSFMRRDQRSALQRRGCGNGGCAGYAYPWRRLRGQVEFHMRQQQAQIGVRFGVAREHQFASVGGRQMHVEHLHSGELFQHRSWGKSTGQRFESSLERDLQAVGKERHEDVRLNAFVLLVIDGADSICSAVTRNRGAPAISIPPRYMSSQFLSGWPRAMSLGNTSKRRPTSA